MDEQASVGVIEAVISFETITKMVAKAVRFR